MILSVTSSNDIHKCTQAALLWPAQTGLNYTEGGKGRERGNERGRDGDNIIRGGWKRMRGEG